MKLQVTECKRSYKYTNMWVVTYEVTTEDFFTGEKTSAQHRIFSLVEVEPGLRTVVKAHSDDYSKFWIKEVKE
jgi:hypothetical protein